jgi:acetyltransferase-like isoleucine patch superfamily enzyme
MMSILLILVVILSVVVLSKWLICIILYPIIALAALGNREADGSLKKFLCFPLKVVEHFLRYGGTRFVIFNISYIPSCHFRKLLYKGLGVKMGKNVTIHFRAELRAPEKLSLGDGAIIGDNAILDARRGLTIGRNVNLSSNVSIYTLQHDHRDPYFGLPSEDKLKLSVEIDDRAWLGANVIVLPGVHIGEGAVCCAGCVVTKDVEPFAVVAGIPARKVNERPHNLKYEFKGKSCRFY